MCRFIVSDSSVTGHNTDTTDGNSDIVSLPQVDQDMSLTGKTSSQQESDQCEFEAKKTESDDLKHEVLKVDNLTAMQEMQIQN